MTAQLLAAGIIFDIQRFSLHNGPGIRTTVFFKGCPLRCAWCQNPEAIDPNPEMAFFAERCQECLRCAAACPAKAVRKETKRRIAFEACTACGACATACPNRALQRIGREWRQEALVAELVKDRDFYRDSGGGVTLSGGEPMQQSPFLLALLPLLKAADIQIALQTSGLFAWSQIEPLLPHLDLIFFDLKHMDAVAHRKLTGCDNRTILANFTRLAQRGAPLQARMPVVPGLNDSQINLAATARFLYQRGHRLVHCLPYHNLGEAKLARLGSAQKPLGLSRPSGADLQTMKAVMAEEGIHAVVYD